MEECQFYKLEVVGSIPTRGTNNLLPLERSGKVLWDSRSYIREVLRQK